MLPFLIQSTYCEAVLLCDPFFSLFFCLVEIPPLPFCARLGFSGALRCAGCSRPSPPVRPLLPAGAGGRSVSGYRAPGAAARHSPLFLPHTQEGQGEEEEGEEAGGGEKGESDVRRVTNILLLAQRRHRLHSCRLNNLLCVSEADRVSLDILL